MDDLFISEASAPFDIFEHGGEDWMNTYFVAETMEPITTYYGAKLYPDYTFETAPRTDILVVPSGGGSLDVDQQDAAYIGFIERAAAEAVWVTSHCWGAFALGAAGVLDGREATTFPGYTDQLAEQNPALGRAVDDARWVRDDWLITSNGGLAAFEAALQLIDLTLGGETADVIADGLVFDPENRAYADAPQISSVPGYPAEEAPLGDGPYTVNILVMDGLFISEAVAPFDIYKHGGEERYQVNLVSADGEPITTYYGAKMGADHSFATAPQADILVVPSGGGSLDAYLEDEALMAWVGEQATGAQLITSHCWGAFTLGGAGLLDGRWATTFPGYFDQLGKMFPSIDRIVEDERIVWDDTVVTSNGGLAAYEGSLTVVEALHGAEVSQTIAAGLVFSAANYDNAQSPLIRD